MGSEDRHVSLDADELRSEIKNETHTDKPWLVLISLPPTLMSWTTSRKSSHFSVYRGRKFVSIVLFPRNRLARTRRDPV